MALREAFLSRYASVHVWFTKRRMPSQGVFSSELAPVGPVPRFPTSVVAWRSLARYNARVALRIPVFVLHYNRAVSIAGPRDSSPNSV